MKITIKSSLQRFIILAIFSLSFLLPSHVIAQKAFEGIVTYKIDTNDNGPSGFTYYLKGDKARMEMEMPAQSQMGKTAFIIDGDKKEMTTLIPRMKMYMQMSIPSMNSNDQDKGTESEEKPVKVGSSEVILGHKCDHWRINNSDGETVDLWNAKGFGNFMMPGSMGGMPGQGRQQQWMKDLMAQGFFPLKIVVTKAGKTEMTMEATKVEQKSLSSSLFEIPSGYNKMNIPNMGHQN